MAKKYKKWSWAQQISFLDTVTALRPTPSNITLISSISTDTLITTAISISPDVESTNKMFIQDNVLPVDNGNIGRRKRLADPATTVVNYLKDRDQNKILLKFYLLFRSYAETVKKYTQLIQAD